jgi:integrase/recombinase XerD
MQAFPVRLPSGVAYWTVLDDELKVLAEAAAYLHQLWFGGDAAESTTKATSRPGASQLQNCHARWPCPARSGAPPDD